MTKISESSVPEEGYWSRSAADKVPDGSAGAAGGPGTERPSFKPTPIRNLSAALVHAAKLLGVVQTDIRYADALPTQGGELTIGRLDEAARKLGLKIKINDKPLTSASPLASPFLAFLNSGETVVVTSLDLQKGVAVLDRVSADGVTSHVLKLEQLGVALKPVYVYVARLDMGLEAMCGPSRGQSDHWFWSAVSRFRSNYLQVVVAGFLVNTLALASPLFIMNVYDRVIPNLTIPTLWALAVGVVIALVFDFVLKTLRAKVVDETGRRVDMAVSGRVFDHLLETRSDARPQSTGVLASHIRDFDNVRDLMTSSTVIAITDAVFIVIFLAVLYWIVGFLVLVPIVAALFVIAATFLVQIPISRAMQKAQSDSARRHGILIETLLSLDLVKRIGGAAHLRRRFDHSVAEASRSATATRFWSNLNTTIVQSASQTVTVVIIVWGVFLVIEGHISVGALIAANILSGRVLAPLASISSTLSRVQQARYSYKSIDSLMALPSEWTAAAATRPLRNQSLTFEEVSYVYPGQDMPAVKGISFTLGQGDCLGIIGRIGSGKSTLGRLVCGLAVPTEGRILIDGVDIKQVPPSELRRFVGIVPQEPELISGTLHDNITMGQPMATPEDIDYAVRMAGIEALARDHPFGLAMPISERGQSLSGGQRHSVALAQTLIRRPKILFLDEPTAALDTSAEKQLLKSLDILAREQGVIVMIATHRHSSLAIADKLLVIDGGALRACGPKDQVLEALQKQAQGAAVSQAGNA